MLTVPEQQPREDTLPADIDTETFVGMALRDMRFLVAASELAENRARDGDLHELARSVGEDHAELAAEIENLRRETGMVLDPDPAQDDHHQRMLTDLEDAADADFDRHFVTRATLVLRQTTEVFRTYAQRGDHEAFRRFAEDNVPILNDQLERFEDMLG